MQIERTLNENSAFYSLNAAPNVTARYHMLPTSTIVEHAERAGYILHSYQQKKPRKAEKYGYAKHIVRLRKPGELIRGDVIPEVVIVNSHDKTSALQFMLGYFRVVCANGLITGDIFDDLGRVLHNHNNTMDAVLDRIDNVYKVSEQKIPVINQMRGIMMDDDLVREFTDRAAVLIPNRIYENPHSLAHINRYEDTQRNLWNVMNTIQENMIRGNNQIIGSNGRSRKSRAIGAVDSNIALNRKLWNLAEEFMPLAA